MIFDELLNLLETPNQIALSKSLANCHADGLFSLVVGGNLTPDSSDLQHGTLTRVFIATKEIKPFDIQLHSHRYGLTIGVISGNFRHHLAAEGFYYDNGEVLTLKEFEYKSTLNGGDGLTFKGEGCYRIKSYDMPVGSEVRLCHDVIHTVSCSVGTIWVVEEHGFKSDFNTVLGIPFKTESLYNPPQQYQTEYLLELVQDKLKLIFN